MTAQPIINRLKTLTKGERMLDIAIAEYLGWKRQVEIVKDPETGGERKDFSWMVPAGTEIKQPPFYTTNLQDAYELVTSIARTSIGGCSWERGQATAKIGSNRFVQAATPQLALCIAALELVAAGPPKYAK